MKWRLPYSFIAIVGAFALSGIAVSRSAAAESVSQSEVPSMRLSRSKHELEVGLAIYQFDYAEELPAPSKSTESGVVPGLHLAYSYRPGFLLRGIVDLANPSMNYDGTTQAPENTPVQADTPTRLMNFEANIGLPLGGGITVYTGFGHHYWMRGDGRYEPGQPLALREDYRWFYLPIGAESEWRLSPRMTLGFDASARFMIAGRMKILASETFVSSNDPTVRLGSRPGVKVSLPMTFVLTGKNLRLKAAPFYQFSAIGKSNVDILEAGSERFLFIEPSSRTHQFGTTCSVTLEM